MCMAQVGMSTNSSPNLSVDLYAVLGLSPTATVDEIKKAFRAKAGEYHPDRNKSESAPAQFRAVREAYDVLGDPIKRQEYDDNRRRNLLDSPTETAREIWGNYINNLLRS